MKLMKQFVIEDEIKNKEDVFGALSSFLRGNNFEGKKIFIEDHGGL